MSLQEQNNGQKETNFFLYLIVIILSIAILSFLNFTIISVTVFMGISSFIMTYFPNASISLGLGFIASIIFNKITDKKKFFVIGNAIISIISSIIIAIYLSVGKVLSGAGGFMGSMFNNMPNAIIMFFVIMIFYNAIPAYNFLKK